MFRSYVILTGLLGLALAVGIGCSDDPPANGGTAGTGGGAAGTGGDGAAGTGGTGGDGAAGTGGTGGDGAAGTGGTGGDGAAGTGGTGGDGAAGTGGTGGDGAAGTGGTGGDGAAGTGGTGGDGAAGTGGTGGAVGLSCPPAAKPPTIVRAACRNSFNQAASTFPISLGIALDDCAVAGADFNATVDPVLALDTAFLQAAADTLCALGNALTSADVSIAQVEIDAVQGATCTSQLAVLPAPLPETVLIPVVIEGMCGAGGTVTVTGEVSITLPQVVLPCTAGAPGEQVTYCPTGETPLGDPIPPPSGTPNNQPNLTLADTPVGSWVGVNVPAGVQPPPIQVVFSCSAPATVNPDPNDPDVSCSQPNAFGGPCAGTVGNGNWGETTNTCTDHASGNPDTFVTPCPWTDANGYNISDCDFSDGFPGTCTAVPIGLPLTECIQFNVESCITDNDCNTGQTCNTGTGVCE